MVRRSPRWPLLGLVLVLLVAPAAAQDGTPSAGTPAPLLPYAAIDLGTLGGQASEAFAINDRGQVAGWAETAKGATHAVLWERGRMTDLGTLPGGRGSVAAGVNDRGQVVGWADTPGGTRHAVRWDEGRITDLGTLPGTTESEARAINSAGQVVGSTLGVPVAVRWDGARPTALAALPDGGVAVALAINDRGQVAGEGGTRAGRIHAIRWTDGTPTDLGTLGGRESRADGLDATGRVVGQAATTGGARHAALWEGGQVTDLGTLPGGGDSEAHAVSATGQVVGWADTADRHEHAVVWDGGRITDLGTLPGGGTSRAQAVDAAGRIVGWAETADRDKHAVLWERNAAITACGALTPVYDAGPAGVVCAFQLDGYSMAPTLVNRDWVLVDRAAYRAGPPQRGDLVVFQPPVSSSRPYLKRVVGLPGETIELKDGAVWIDGRQLDEPYLKPGATTECWTRPCRLVTVPAGAVFVLGDNRSNSSDSRVFGPVGLDHLLGKAWFAYRVPGGRPLASPDAWGAPPAGTPTASCQRCRS